VMEFGNGSVRPSCSIDTGVDAALGSFFLSITVLVFLMTTYDPGEITIRDI
jgi:hypothetical protein